jgi:hypothetical protein
MRFGKISGDPDVDPELSLAESEGERGCVGWVKYVGMGTVSERRNGQSGSEQGVYRETGDKDEIVRVAI